MLKYISAIFLLIGLVSCSVQPNKKPNIILIMVDDLGWGDVGFNGNTHIKTPSLDALASKGVIFNRFYSASAVCSPTRASCITGRNPFRMEIPTANAGRMKEGEITLAEVLKTASYETAHFGKWHLGSLTTKEKDANRGKPGRTDVYTIPSSHGYDAFFCTESKVPTFDPLVKPLTYDSANGEGLRFGWKAIEPNRPSEAYGTSYWIGKEKKEEMNMEGDDSKLIMDRVIPFIENAVDENNPFFSTVWFHTPHLPVVADEAHRNLYKELDLQHQIYYGTITALDEQIGRLWKRLEDLGEADNTILWFCSDNGPERGTPGSSGIFRERKRSLYEGGVRVPAFAVLGKNFPKNYQTDLPVVTSDYLPTILEMIGISYPDADRPLDGESIANALMNKQSERGKPIGFLYSSKMSWVSNEYKLISTNGGSTFELYNLINDPEEKKNIAATNMVLVTNMKKELMAWKQSVMESANGVDY